METNSSIRVLAFVSLAFLIFLTTGKKEKDTTTSLPEQSKPNEKTIIASIGGTLTTMCSCERIG